MRTIAFFNNLEIRATRSLIIFNCSQGDSPPVRLKREKNGTGICHVKQGKESIFDSF